MQSSDVADVSPTTMEAALGYAALGWSVLPGAVWSDGALVDPATGDPVDDVALKPRAEATTDVALVREWWSTDGASSPAILCVTGPSFGVVSVGVDRAEAIMAHQWFATRPTPVI